MTKIFRFTVAALIASASIFCEKANAHESSPRICESLGWGTDLQAVFPGYRLAICIGGMNPTHMVVVQESNISNQKTVVAMPLNELRSFESAGFEGATTVGNRNGSWASYESTNNGAVYQVDVMKNGWTTLTISAGRSTVYSQGSNDVEFVNLFLPKDY